MNIVLYPDKRLRARTNKVEHFGRELRQSAMRMVKLMMANDGVGLAANQAGLSQRFFVIAPGLIPNPNIVDSSQPYLFVIANPSWVGVGKKTIVQEGCLSFPGITIERERFTQVKVSFQDIDGKAHKMVLQGLAAHVFQHETEHLDGKLMVDHLKSICN